MIDHRSAMKALTVLAIEKALSDIGKPLYETAIHMLYRKYHCYVPDCYEKPEYLKNVLKHLYGVSYNEIVNSIEKELKEFTNDRKIETFLQMLA